MHIAWLEHGFLDEWDYWAGTFGLVLLAVIETIIFIWVFSPRTRGGRSTRGPTSAFPRSSSSS